MAKAKSGKAKPKGDAPTTVSGDSERRYKVEDGLRTLTRAEELKGDKPLMRDIAAHAAEQAEMAKRAAAMVKSGVISDKQAAKLPGAEAEGAGKAAE